MTAKLTGRHVLIIAIACFGLVIAANIAMLLAATGSFPGLVVKNSYVASQGWNDRADAQRALGWRAAVVLEEGRLAVTLTGADGPVEDAVLTARIGRPSSDAEDREIALTRTGAGRYAAPADLAPGLWRVEITSASPAYTVARTLTVPEPR